MPDDAIYRMLNGALVAYSDTIEFKLSGDAADFLTGRAIDNIQRNIGPTDPKSRLYHGALIGIINLPQFFAVVERVTPERQLPDRRAAENMIAATLGGRWHVYPWCAMRP
jgi:hypothetical protein